MKMLQSIWDIDPEFLIWCEIFSERYIGGFSVLQHAMRVIYYVRANMQPCAEQSLGDGQLQSTATTPDSDNKAAVAVEAKYEDLSLQSSL